MNEKGTDKTKAIIKLVLWLVFIVVLMIIARVGNKNEETNLQEPQEEIKEEQPQEKTYEEKFNNLVSNYEYKYEIKVGNDIYKYEGAKMLVNEEVKESGFVQYNEEHKYNYFLENGYIYQVNNGGLDKIETIYANNIDSTNLDIDKIKVLIANKEYTIEDDTDYNQYEKKYTYILDDRKIIVYTKENDIGRIDTYIGEDYYKIDFISIGTVKEIKY